VAKSPCGIGPNELGLFLGNEMNRRRRALQLLVPAAMAVGLLGTPCARATGGKAVEYCSDRIPDKVWSGDKFYQSNSFHNWCNNEWLRVAARNWGMKSTHWNNSTGWNDACNTDKWVARVFTARVAAEVSAPNPAYTTAEYLAALLEGRPLLDRGMRYITSVVDDLRPSCSHGSRSDVATCYNCDAPVFLGVRLSGSRRIELHVAPGNGARGFFERAVPDRMGVLIHEARHWESKKPHNAGSSKDSSWSYNGAYRWQATWLGDYAKLGHAPTALRCYAQNRANTILIANFQSRPKGADGKNLVFSGAPNCTWKVEQ
jgi:hypothetical protein